MRRNSFLGQVRLRPYLAQPGRDVLVSCPRPAEIREGARATAQLRDVDGSLMTEVVLTPTARSLKGVLGVPERAQDGSYSLAITVGGQSWLVTTLVVLSELTLRQIRMAGKADRRRKEAYRVAAHNKLEKALQLLSVAEALYRQAGWEHLEAETIMEKAYVLAKSERQREHKISLKMAMRRFNLAGAKNRRNLAYGKAWLYFEKARDLAVQLCDERNAAVNRNNLGEVFLYLRLLPEARENLLLALQGAKRLGDTKIKAVAHKNLAAVYLLERQFEYGAIELREAARLFEELGEPEKRTEVNRQLEQLEEILRSAGTMEIQIKPAEPISMKTEETEQSEEAC